MAENSTKKKSRATLRQEAKSRLLGYITAGFGLVASLAWNEAIKELITIIYPADQDGLQAKFMYALLVTLVVVLVGYYASRFVPED